MADPTDMSSLSRRISDVTERPLPELDRPLRPPLLLPPLRLFPALLPVVLPFSNDDDDDGVEVPPDENPVRPLSNEAGGIFLDDRLPLLTLPSLPFLGRGVLRPRRSREMPPFFFLPLPPMEISSGSIDC